MTRADTMSTEHRSLVVIRLNLFRCTGGGGGNSREIASTIARRRIRGLTGWAQEVDRSNVFSTGLSLLMITHYDVPSKKRQFARGQMEL